MALWIVPQGVGRGKLAFEVRVGQGLLPKPTDGRVMLAIGRPGTREPRRLLGQAESNAAAMLGADGYHLTAGSTVTLDERSLIFPIAHLFKLAPGNYVVQAVFAHNRDLCLPDAPGNLFSEPVALYLDPASSGTIPIELTRVVPEERLPTDTAEIKYLRLRSERLSKFHGRDIYLRAGVILPRGFAENQEKKYPLRLHIGGFGSRFTAVQRMMSPFAEFRRVWNDPSVPQFLLLHVDGAGPFGDPYQVDSANHGPYGAAITEELIPYVEKHYRGIGAGWARVVDGHSTGGWVSLALQTFYPDFFQGAWSHAPDPVDFRAFELINLYRDENVYLTADGKERPAARDVFDRIRYTMRHEVRSEMILGRGDNWTLSGKDWGSWNATFGPRGKDGLPVPLWDKHTGKIDRSVLAHWKQYDLRVRLEENWGDLAPKLAGKLRIWVGERDDYYLNHAVHLLEGFLSMAQPPARAKITFAPGRDHSWRGLSERELVQQMGAAVEAARPKP